MEMIEREKTIMQISNKKPPPELSTASSPRPILLPRIKKYSLAIF
ncbi:hypothetical protein CCACVL1_19559 [Corchorus capsularis]|uniref:Uncharacterized protein n=1 Tax=Corchorus capsularis TaxID=210143 RepID=A0A1R3HG10_COCAP|nr:hypothetical protein CCACVL1_19559 [Corchorus capsularis]